jgi:hypothetical protein
MFDRHTRIHLLALAAFSMALFLPMIGRGFIHDDFAHMNSAAFDSISYVLKHASWPAFYTPITSLSYKLEWMLWGGKSAFPFAAVNLLIHIANTALLYLLAFSLWRSHTAAFFAGFGFALLFPANAWAVMWISARGHLLVTFFFLAALLATAWLTQTQRFRRLAIIAVILCAALSMFSKENGLAVLAGVCILILYAGFSERRWIGLYAALSLLGAMFVLLAVYFWLRAGSGAAPATAGDRGYSYVLSLGVLLENFLRYAWRTYGLLLLLALAVSAYIGGKRPCLKPLKWEYWFLSLSLFVVMLAPVVLLKVRSGVYTYLPGVAAALLFGAAAHQILSSPIQSSPRHLRMRWAPLVLTTGVFAAFTIGQNIKWMRMAEVNSIVLEQIAKQQPTLESSALIVLTYAEVDSAHWFPAGFAYWGFPFAVRHLYGDRTVNGLIVREGKPYAKDGAGMEVRFTYSVVDGTPRIVKTGN